MVLDMRAERLFQVLEEVADLEDRRLGAARDHILLVVSGIKAPTSHR